MKLSRREMVLGLLTVSAVLLAAAALLIRPKIAEWRELRAKQRAVREEIAADKRLVHSREEWEKRLAELSEQLQQFGPQRETEVYFLSLMDKLASQNGIRILKHRAGEEEKAGDIYELPIECQQWEGTLDSLVHFLFDLQSHGAMLDIHQLLVKPKQAGVLRGRFLLFCAYTRGSEGEG